MTPGGEGDVLAEPLRPLEAIEADLLAALGREAEVASGRISAGSDDEDASCGLARDLAEAVQRVRALRADPSPGPAGLPGMDKVVAVIWQELQEAGFTTEAADALVSRIRTRLSP